MAASESPRIVLVEWLSLGKIAIQYNRENKLKNKVERWMQILAIEHWILTISKPTHSNEALR